MKKLFYSFHICVITLLSSCGARTEGINESASSGDSTAPLMIDTMAAVPNRSEEPTTSAYSLNVEDEQGEPLQITPKSDEIVIAFGSWCPHSANLLKALSAKQFNSFFDKEKIIFIVDSKEIDNYKKMLKASGQYTEDELEPYFAQLDQTKEYSKLVDPKCLKNLSKFTYYYADHNSLGINGVPNGYNNSTGNFQSDYITPLAELYSKKDFDMAQSFVDYFENLEKQDK